MLPLRIVIGVDGIFPDSAQCFAYTNGSFVILVYCQQHFFHAVLLCNLQPKAKDLFAVSFPKPKTAPMHNTRPASPKHCTTVAWA